MAIQLFIALDCFVAYAPRNDGSEKMFSALKKIFEPSFTREAHECYLAVVAQARKPWFYRVPQVPDTIDGRFDVIVLHLFLLIHRLRREHSQDAGRFIRALSEVFFADMDRSLREEGVGDTGVGLRVKRMAQAFYGRLQTYEQTFFASALFEESLARNIYRGENVSSDSMQLLADYVRRNAEYLAQQPTASILAGEISFLD